MNRELDELEREDFTRLKMVKKKKEIQIKAEEGEKRKRAAALAVQTAAASAAGAGATASMSHLHVSTVFETEERGGEETGPIIRAKNPMISAYVSPKKVISPTRSSLYSSRERGMDDLADDADDVVFK